LDIQSLSVSTNPRLNVIPQNVTKPTASIPLPILHERIDTTPQLVLCIGLLPKKDYGPVDQQEDVSQDRGPTDASQLAWIKELEQDQIKQDHIRWLGRQWLGEIASDDIWDTSIRKQTIDVHEDLYKNDPEWATDGSVRAWMMHIFGQLGAKS